MQETNINWTLFRRKININDSLKSVYDAWATQRNIEKWFLQEAIYRSPDKHQRGTDDHIMKGDTFTWKWHNYDIKEDGEILKADGTNNIAFTFGPAGNVHVSLKTIPSGTELTLTQDNIPTDDKSKRSFFYGCGTGWTFWLTNLKAWLEHGITLHDTALDPSETADRVNS